MTANQKLELEGMFLRVHFFGNLELSNMNSRIYLGQINALNLGHGTYLVCVQASESPLLLVELAKP